MRKKWKETNWQIQLPTASYYFHLWVGSCGGRVGSQVSLDRPCCSGWSQLPLETVSNSKVLASLVPASASPTPYGCGKI